mmetsp:Transcript_73774/g.186534  ORF Transcript_73774/g.186534 Transcript_73774/m.186534 type:complete len:107 (+) Transcript_73774:594-914(+)
MLLASGRCPLAPPRTARPARHQRRTGHKAMPATTLCKPPLSSMETCWSRKEHYALAAAVEDPPPASATAPLMPPPSPLYLPHRDTTAGYDRPLVRRATERLQRRHW